MSSLTTSTRESIVLEMIIKGVGVSPYSKEQILSHPATYLSKGVAVRLGDDVIYRTMSGEIQIVPIESFGDLSKLLNNADFASVEGLSRTAMDKFGCEGKLNPFNGLSPGSVFEIHGPDFSVRTFSINSGYCDLVVVAKVGDNWTGFVSYSTKTLLNPSLKHSGDKSAAVNGMTLLMHDCSTSNLGEGQVLVVCLYGYQKQKLHSFANKGLDPQVIIEANGTNYLYIPDLSERAADGTYVPVYIITKIGGKVYAYVPEDPLVVDGVNTMSSTSQFTRNMKNDVDSHLDALHLKLVVQQSGSKEVSSSKKESTCSNDSSNSSFKVSSDDGSYPPSAVFVHGAIVGVEGIRITGEYMFPVSPTKGPFTLYQKGVSPVPFGPGQVRIYHYYSDGLCLASFFTGSLANNCIFVCHLKPGQDIYSVKHPMFLNASAFSICLFYTSDKEYIVARPFIGDHWNVDASDPGTDFTDRFESITRMDGESKVDKPDDFTPKEGFNIKFGQASLDLPELQLVFEGMEDIDEAQFAIINALKQIQYLCPDSVIEEIKIAFLKKFQGANQFPKIRQEIQKLRQKVAEFILKDDMDSAQGLKQTIGQMLSELKVRSKKARSGFSCLENYLLEGFTSYLGVTSLTQVTARKNAAAELRKAKISSNVADAAKKSGFQILEALVDEDGNMLIAPLPNTCLGRIVDAMKSLNDKKQLLDFIQVLMNRRCLELDSSTVEALAEVAPASPLSIRDRASFDGLVLTLKDGQSAFAIPIASMFTLQRTASIPWHEIANGPISQYRIKLRSLVQKFAEANGYVIPPNDYSIGMVIILIMLEIAEKFVEDIMANRLVDVPEDLTDLYKERAVLKKDPEANKDKIEEIECALEEKIPKPVQYVRMLLGIVLSGCAAGQKGACNIWKMVFPDNTSPKKLLGIDWLIGLRIAKLMPYANWDNTFCFDNLRKWLGGMCWRIAEPLITSTTKVQKKAEKASKNKFLKSRNQELAFLFVVKRILYSINLWIKEKGLTEDSVFPEEYQEMINNLFHFYKKTNFLNPKGGTQIIVEILQSSITWTSFQYALLVVRNIAVKRSGTFTMIKQKLIVALESGSVEEVAKLRQELLDKCIDISEKAFLFEELPENTCQNFEKFMEDDYSLDSSSSPKGDGELGRIAWQVSEEDRPDFEKLIAKAEEIAGRSLSLSSLAEPVEEVAASEVVAAMVQENMMLENSSGEEKSSGSAVSDPIDSLKAAILGANVGDACSERLIGFAQGLTPAIAVEMICKEYKMNPGELKSIFELLEIDRFDERLCEGILIALKVRDYDKAMSAIKKSFK
jgi:hypothetical protein